MSQSIGALRFAPWMLKPVNSLLMLSRDEEPHVLLPAEGVSSRASWKDTGSAV